MQNASRVRVANSKTGVIITVGLAALLFSMSTNMVAVALPRLAGDLNASIAMAQWVVVSFFLAVTNIMFVLSRLSDRFGQRVIFTGGIGVFTVASAFGGMASSIEQVIVIRALQGLGAAVIMGNAVAILAHSFRENERGKAVGFYNLALGMGTIVGSVAGGFIVDNLGWRWVFFANVPIGLLIVGLSLVVIARGEVSRGQSFDWIGAATFSIGLTALLLALSEVQQGRWGSPLALQLATVGIVSLSFFCIVETRVASPMIDLRLFRNWNFSLAASGSSLQFIANLPIVFLLPFYLEKVLHFSPSSVGILLIPSSLCYSLIAPFGGWLADRYPGRGLQATGLAIVCIGEFWLSRLGVSSTYLDVLAGQIVLGVGLGLFATPNTRMGLTVVPRESLNMASAIMGTMRNLGKTVGTAFAAAIVTMRLPYYVDQYSAGPAATPEAIQPQALSASIGDGLLFITLLVGLGVVMMVYPRLERRTEKVRA